MRTLEKVDHPFLSPFSGSVLIKGAEEDGKWIVYMEASNEGLDQEEEQILQKGLKEAKDYYLSHGVISWDHQHKHQHEPKYIIGEPMDVRFPKDGRTLVKGWLYQHNETAIDLWKNIQSGARLGASIGGGVIQKSQPGEDGKSWPVISRVLWNETAITHKPVNQDTLGKTTLVPFPEFAKALMASADVLDKQDETDPFWKAMMAGSGVDASSFTGGRALTGESLDEKLVDLTFGQTDLHPTMTYEEGRRYFDGMLKAIHHGKIASLNDVVSYTLDQGYPDGVAATLIDFVARKIPKLRR